MDSKDPDMSFEAQTTFCERNALESTCVFSDELFNCSDGGMDYEELKEPLSNVCHLQDICPNGLNVAGKCTTINFEPKITAIYSLDPSTNSTGFAHARLNYAETKAVDTPRPTTTMDSFLPDHLGGWHTMEGMIQNEEEIFRKRWPTSTVRETVSKQAAVDAGYYAVNEFLSTDYHAIKHVKRDLFIPSVERKRRQDASNFDNGNEMHYKFEESRKHDISSIDSITNGPQRTGWQFKIDQSACNTEIFWPVDFLAHGKQPSKDVILPHKPHEGLLFDETNLSLPSVAPFQSYGLKIHPTHWENSSETHNKFHPCPSVFVGGTHQDMHKGKNAASWHLESREVNLISPKENIRQFYDQRGSSGMCLNSQRSFPSKREGPAGWSLAPAHKSDPNRQINYVHHVHQSAALGKSRQSHNQPSSPSLDAGLLYVGTRDDHTVTGLKPKGEIPSRSQMTSPTYRPIYVQKHGDMLKLDPCCLADDAVSQRYCQASRQTHKPIITQSKSLSVGRSIHVDTDSKSSMEKRVRCPSDVGSRRSETTLLRAPTAVPFKHCEEWDQAEKTVERIPNYGNLTPPITAAHLIKMPQKGRAKRVPDHIYLELLQPPKTFDMGEYERGKTAFYRRKRRSVPCQSIMENCISTSW